MSIAFGFHPLAVAISLLLAALLTWWTYRRTTPPVSTLRRGTLIALRWSALSLVLLLLAEPVIRTVVHTSRIPIVAVLFDTSRSLSDSVHPGKDFSESIRQAYEQIERAVDGADVETFSFGSDVAPWIPTADSISFDGGRTDIAAALESIRSKYAGRPLRGVVLVSDGRFNTGSNPLYVAERFPAPIHTVVVGDTATYRDLRIERIATNEIGYVDREMPVQVTLHVKGFPGERVHVALSGSHMTASESDVVLPETEAEINVDLTMTPSVEGFQRFSALVDTLAGERTTANNRMSFSVRVVRRKLTVMFLAAGPSPDVAALRETLSADPDLDIDAHTQRSATEWYGGPPPQSFDSFDLVVLAGYPGRQSNPAVLESIQASAKPVLFLLDRTTDLRLVREELGAVLPATVQTIRQGFVEASPVETAVGRTHPILNLPGPIDRLPPLSYSSSRWEPTPDAKTLATVAIRGVTLDDPLLVVRSRGGTRSAAILGSGVWRWRNVPGDLSDLDEVFPELVSNLLQWLTTTSDDRPVRVTPAEELFDGADNVQFTGEIYDESLDPIPDASLTLSVTDPTGSTFDYRMEPLGNGRYARALGRLPEGSYRYHAVAEKEGLTLGADSGQFAVGELLLEFQDTQADPALMRQIARRSGGTFTHFGEISTLGDRLADLHSFDKERIAEEKQLALRRFLPILLVIVVLLSAEWIVRKRSGMV